MAIPRPGSTEYELLWDILLQLQTNGSGGSNQGHFDASGNIQIYDPVNNTWRTLTAPNGILTIT